MMVLYQHSIYYYYIVFIFHISYKYTRRRSRYASLSKIRISAYYLCIVDIFGRFYAVKIKIKIKKIKNINKST